MILEKKFFLASAAPPPPLLPQGQGCTAPLPPAPQLRRLLRAAALLLLQPVEVLRKASDGVSRPGPGDTGGRNAGRLGERMGWAP